MKILQTEIIITATAEKVWSVLTAFEKFPEWNPFILSIEGKQEVGGQLKVVLKNGNGTSVFKPQILVCDRNKAFEWLGSLPLGIFSGHHQFRIEKLNNAQVKFIHQEEFTGLLSGIIIKQIGGATKQGFISMNEALKERAER